MYVHIHVHVHVHIYTCVHARTHTHNVVYACSYIRTCNAQVHAHLHTDTYTCTRTESATEISTGMKIYASQLVRQLGFVATRIDEDHLTVPFIVNIAEEHVKVLVCVCVCMHVCMCIPIYIQFIPQSVCVCVCKCFTNQSNPLLEFLCVSMFVLHIHATHVCMCLPPRTFCPFLREHSCVHR